jgi:hypothetical protein
MFASFEESEKQNLIWRKKKKLYAYRYYKVDLYVPSHWRICGGMKNLSSQALQFANTIFMLRLLIKQRDPYFFLLNKSSISLRNYPSTPSPPHRRPFAAPSPPLCHPFATPSPPMAASPRPTWRRTVATNDE